MSARRLTSVLALLAAPLAAQEPVRIRSAVFFEQYRFDAGFVVREMSEMTIPLLVDVPLGERVSLVASTGYVSVNLKSADPAQLGDQHLGGLMDTEVRLTMNVRPGRLITFLSGTLPTGQRTVAEDELSVLVTLANDGIGFATTSVGSGGNFGGGVSVAWPVGRLALGAAATGTYAFAYQPIAGQPQDLKPGTEVRLRLGLEGPFGRRGYVRTAWAMAMRQKDAFAGATQHGLGRRTIAYATVEQGVGAAVIGLHAFNVARGDPQLEPSALGSAVLPRGNLFAAGATLTTALGARASLTPRVEWRVSAAARDTGGTALVREASSLRAGADLRFRLGGGRTLVMQADRLGGEVLQAGSYYGMRGFRGAVHLEVVR